MVRWLRWHCPPDTGFEIRALAVWGRARYLSVTEAPHNTNFHTWMGKKQFCFFQTAEAGNRTPDSGVKGSGANHYPRAPALKILWDRSFPRMWNDIFATMKSNLNTISYLLWLNYKKRTEKDTKQNIGTIPLPINHSTKTVRPTVLIILKTRE